MMMALSSNAHTADTHIAITCPASRFVVILSKPHPIILNELYMYSLCGIIITTLSILLFRRGDMFCEGVGIFGAIIGTIMTLYGLAPLFNILQ